MSRAARTGAVSGARLRAAGQAVTLLVAGLASLLGGCQVDPYCLSCGRSPDAGTDVGASMDSGRPDARVDATIADAGVDAGPRDAGRPDGCLEAELCNDLDDDCDGFVDEDFDLRRDPSHCGSCGRVCAPPHAFGLCEDGTCALGDCDLGWYDLDSSPDNGCEYRCSLTPAADDRVCNLEDDDCDGAIDEDVDLTTDAANCGRCGRVCRPPRGTGACVDGACAVAGCDAGYVDLNGLPADGCEYACVPSEPPTEVCDLLDNDCDGSVDEGNPGGGVSCGTDEGACAMGTTRCSAGRVLCEGATGPSTEACNAVDDDCDGSVDEGNPGGGRVCGSSAGVCETGVQQCVAGALVCVGAREGGPEVCNNLDDDCDGAVDDATTDGGAACNLAPSGVATGACTSTGRVSCVAGALVCVGAPAPSAELCNAVDDDCDGSVDEDDPGAGGLCGTDLGRCTPGNFECRDGALVCAGEVGPSAELCNGIDDDCDGTVDDGNPDGGAACGETTGECAAGALVCRGGTLVCEGFVGPAAELCNGLDEDCDGTPDDGFSLSTDVNNCGRCGNVCSLPNATPRCTSGACQVASCNAGFVDLSPSAPGCEYACSFRGGEACNGLDDDCDGLVDEGVTAPTGICNPNGVCAGTSASCGGGAGWVCRYPTTYEEVETRCDGLDNDCDGLVDEAFALRGASCSNGVGACRRTGVYVCNATEDGVTCNASAAGVEADESCNGLDDDCDGLVDERTANDPSTPWRDGIDLTAIPTTSVTLPGGATVRVMQYEASRPDATSSAAGSLGNLACSRPNVVPWTSVTWDQAQTACCALNADGNCPGAGGSGWRLCEALDWQTACEGPTSTCEWSYGASCELSQPTACNGAEHDCNASIPGDQDCLYTTASPTFPMCFTSWGTSGVYDMSGNVREWTATSRGSNLFEVRGGSYNHIEAGRSCGFDFAVAERTDALPNTGFRCCFY
jgi:hypothetical protein